MTDALRTELTDDPEGRGYSSMSDQEVADDLNTSYRSRNRTSMTSSEVLNAVDSAEYIKLSNDAKTEFWNLMGLGTLNPFGIEAVLMKNLFGRLSKTIATLKSLRVESITRAVERGFGEVKSRHVGYARSS